MKLERVLADRGNKVGSSVPGLQRAVDLSLETGGQFKRASRRWRVFDGLGVWWCYARVKLWGRSDVWSSTSWANWPRTTEARRHLMDGWGRSTRKIVAGDDGRRWFSDSPGPCLLSLPLVLCFWSRGFLLFRWAEVKMPRWKRMEPSAVQPRNRFQLLERGGEKKNGGWESSSFSPPKNPISWRPICPLRLSLHRHRTLEKLIYFLSLG